MNDKEQTSITLNTTLDTAAAEAFHKRMLEEANLNKDLCLNGNNVERIGTSCIQILIATKKKLTQNGHTLKINKPSTPLVDALTAFGLKEQLLGEQ